MTTIFFLQSPSHVQDLHLSRRCQVEQFFKDRVYLPSKDLTHMLVFESKSTELHFKEQLTSRTPIGNFVRRFCLRYDFDFHLSCSPCDV